MADNKSLGKQLKQFLDYLVKFTGDLDPDVPGNRAPKKKKQVSTKPKPAKRWTDPAFKGLNTFYVMNNVVQMPTGKFNNLYDSVYLYLDPKFSSEKAVEYITGRFDTESKSSKKYFK